MRKKKIVFLHNIIYPQRNRFFNLLYKSGKYDFKVLFLSDTSINRKWDISEEKLDFPYRVLKNFRFSLPDIDTYEYIFNPLAIIDFFIEEKDAVVTIGWANFTNLIFMLLSILTKTPYFIWCESTINENTIRRKLSNPLITFFVRHARACFVPGALAKKHIRTFSKDVPIYVIPNSVNNSLFSKDENRINNKKVDILFVGRFERSKDLPALISVCERLDKKYPNIIRLTIVGYGPEEDYLRMMAKKNNLKFVRILGYTKRQELYKYYSLGDIFVLPSIREVWGFVVNEAMASETPVIVSDKVGCGPDLVKHGKNGYIFKAGDVDDLYRYLEKLVFNRKLRDKMGRECLKIIKNFTHERMVKKFNKSIKI